MNEPMADLCVGCAVMASLVTGAVLVAFGSPAGWVPAVALDLWLSAEEVIRDG